MLTGEDTADAVVARPRETFGQAAVSLLARGQAGWVVRTSSGPPYPVPPRTATPGCAVDDGPVLALCGAPLRASDQRVLKAFAVQTGMVLEYRRLREREERVANLERAEATSVALLRAVSHDLRTPLATMRAAVKGLLAPGVADEDRRELVRSVGASATDLERLIDDLLDLSRLQSGLVHPVLRPRSLDEVLPLAVAGQPAHVVQLEVEEPAPLITSDAGLLERVVANLVDNAVRHGGTAPVRVLAHELPETVEVMVVDRGPGLRPEDRDRVFEPFQRLGGTSPGGLGLGLAVARGLTEALGGSLTTEDTPGGGLTMVLSLPRATAGSAGRAEAS